MKKWSIQYQQVYIFSYHTEIIFFLQQILLIYFYLIIDIKRGYWKKTSDWTSKDMTPGTSSESTVNPPLDIIPGSPSQWPGYDTSRVRLKHYKTYYSDGIKITLCEANVMFVHYNVKRIYYSDNEWIELRLLKL